MRRSTLTLAAASTLILGACSGGEVVVTAAIEVTGAEGTRVQTLDDIEVELIPFDRDQIFDSLAAAANTPEPEIPQELLEAQDSISAAQERWQAMNDRWSQLRDSLQALNEAMSRYSPAEARYREMFSIYNELEGEYNRLDTQKQQAFERFDELQQASVDQENEVRMRRNTWADDAFADVGAIYEAREREAGREIQVDTTGSPVAVGVEGAPGTARFTGLRSGTWYVHARYALPFSELYWNIPVEVEGGETVTVELTRENAIERPPF